MTYFKFAASFLRKNIGCSRKPKSSCCCPRLDIAHRDIHNVTIGHRAALLCGIVCLKVSHIVVDSHKTTITTTTQPPVLPSYYIYHPSNIDMTYRPCSFELPRWKGNEKSVLSILISVYTINSVARTRWDAMHFQHTERLTRTLATEDLHEDKVCNNLLFMGMRTRKKHDFQREYRIG